MTFPANPAARLTSGALLPFRAAGWLAARRALWPLALLPMVLTGAGLVVGALAAVPLSGALLSAVWAQPAGWLVAAWWISRLAVGLLLVFAAAVVLPIALAAPVMERLSVRVEEVELGAASAAGGLRRAAAETATGLGNTVARLGLFLLGHLALLPALLVPFLWPVLAFLWTARWSAVEWLDLPMARHLHRLRDVRAALRAVRPLGMGMGGTLAALFLLPLANLLVVPVGAIAGTLLYCDLVRAGVVAPEAPAPAPTRKDLRA